MRSSYSYAQVMDFSDMHTVKTFKLNVGLIRFTTVRIDSVYDSESHKDAPNKYYSELEFGKYMFQLKTFDNHNKLALITSKQFLAKGFGKYSEPDGFSRSYDLKTKTEHYQSNKGAWYDISFQNQKSYPDDWIEVHIKVSVNGTSDTTIKKYFFYKGSGSFLYNTKTREIKRG